MRLSYMANKYRFQSSPTPEGGRYSRGAVVSNALPMFQSSPTPEGGRYEAAIASWGTSSRFQSSPTPEGGRYRIRPVAG